MKILYDIIHNIWYYMRRKKEKTQIHKKVKEHRKRIVKGVDKSPTSYDIVASHNKTTNNYIEINKLCNLNPNYIDKQLLSTHHESTTEHAIIIGKIKLVDENTVEIDKKIVEIDVKLRVRDNKNGVIVKEEIKLDCENIDKTDVIFKEEIKLDCVNIDKTDVILKEEIKIGKAIINYKDYGPLAKFTWHENCDGYPENNQKGVLHRILMGKPPGTMVIDHSNRIKFDNTRDNLRFITKSENAMNREKMEREGTSIYKNVVLYKSTGKYVARITNNYELFFLGNYDNEIEAAEAVDMYIVHNNLHYYKLNFPDKRDEYLNSNYIPPYKEQTSKYTGVCISSKKDELPILYKARVCVKGKYILDLENYDEEVCARAYDETIVENNIPMKKLNFPEEHPEYNPRNEIRTLGELQKNGSIKLLINCDIGIPLVDKEDYELIKYYTCSVTKDGYVVFCGEKRMFLHRFLMNPGDDEVVDHLNNEKMDNRRSNLENTTIAKNNQNKAKREGGTSVYIGVALEKNRWKMNVCKDGIAFVLSGLRDEETAARIRDIYILLNYKNENYKLNFVWTDDDIKYWEKVFNDKTYK